MSAYQLHAPAVWSGMGNPTVYSCRCRKECTEQLWRATRQRLKQKATEGYLLIRKKRWSRLTFLAHFPPRFPVLRCYLWFNPKYSSGTIHEAMFLSANILAQSGQKKATGNVFPLAVTTTLDSLLENTHVQNGSPLAFRLQIFFSQRSSRTHSKNMGHVERTHFICSYCFWKFSPVIQLFWY